MRSVSRRFAVVDLETTGFSGRDRIVEIGSVRLDGNGDVVDTFETLLNPQRDVGPTHKHGISASHVAAAPTFEQVAGALAAYLDGCVLVAHNLPFDSRMLVGEYERLGHVFDIGNGLCTYQATRMKLDHACAEFGIALDHHHRALGDAMATAQLLNKVGVDLTGVVPIAADHIPVHADVPLVTREDVGFTEDPVKSSGAIRSDPDFVLKPGMAVCLTGVVVRSDGRKLRRDVIEVLCREAGIHVVPRVTKSKCDALIASDTESESGKAKAARSYGKPIITMDAVMADLEITEVHINAAERGEVAGSHRRSKRPRTKPASVSKSRREPASAPDAGQEIAISIPELIAETHVRQAVPTSSVDRVRLPRAFRLRTIGASFGMGFIAFCIAAIVWPSGTGWAFLAAAGVTFAAYVFDGRKYCPTCDRRLRRGACRRCPSGPSD